MAHETTVVIVGAGPAGLATSACLNLENIPNIVLEREDCYASLWRKRAYDRLKLHLAKQFCELPYMSYPSNAPTYVPKNGFIQYLDNYVHHFNVTPLYHRHVMSASFEQDEGNWVIVTENKQFRTTEKWVAKFLVVATGENGERYIPPIPGLDSFSGEVIHSNSYNNGERFRDKQVLVVGSGNSGMEIALDLANWSAHTSIVIRSPMHILSKEVVRLGMILLKYLPINLVDNLVLILSRLQFGNLSGYGIERPKKGPFCLKKETGRSPVIDAGTVAKIRAHEVEVLPSIEKVDGHQIHFMSGQRNSFDAIVFATGYRSVVKNGLRMVDGFWRGWNAQNSPPNHWKGKNRLYCAGFARKGLAGISNDAKAISQDINWILSHQNQL